MLERAAAHDDWFSFNFTITLRFVNPDCVSVCANLLILNDDSFRCTSARHKKNMNGNNFSQLI